MIQAWLAKQGWSLLWKALPWLIIAGLALTVYGTWQAKGRAELAQQVAEKQLADAVQVNKDNELAMLKLQRQQEADRRLAAQELESAKARTKTITVIKKEQRYAPDANDQLTPYDHDFFERLRQSRNPG